MLRAARPEYWILDCAHPRPDQNLLAVLTTDEGGRTTARNRQ
jgi:hypothetical protein